MENPVSKTMNGSLAQSLKAQKGLAQYEITIGIKYITLAVLTAFHNATITARNLYEAGKKLLRDYNDVLAAAMKDARAFAMLTRDILKPVFGQGYSEAWNEAGFNGSLETPTNVDDMLVLLQNLKDFFTANPALEVEKCNITAAQAEALYTALWDANGNVTLQDAAVGDLLKTRDAKFDALREALRTLIDELSHLINPLDERWTAFGFNKPGADETPDAPEGLVVTLIGPTAAAMKWNPAAGAAYYRIWKKVDGVDAALVAAGSPADLDFTLENLPANSTIEIAVSAVNNGGESAPSKAITITTH